MPDLVAAFDDGVGQSLIYSRFVDRSLINQCLVLSQGYPWLFGFLSSLFHMQSCGNVLFPRFLSADCDVDLGVNVGLHFYQLLLEVLCCLRLRFSSSTLLYLINCVEIQLFANYSKKPQTRRRRRRRDHEIELECKTMGILTANGT